MVHAANPGMHDGSSCPVMWSELEKAEMGATYPVKICGLYLALQDLQKHEKAIIENLEKLASNYCDRILECTERTHYFR